MRFSFILPPAAIILLLIVGIAGTLNSQTLSGSISWDAAIENGITPELPDQVDTRASDGINNLLFSSTYNNALQLDEYSGSIATLNGAYTVMVDGINFETTVDQLEAVNVVDITALRRGILGLDNTPQAWKRIAGDVNNNGVYSTQDQIIITRAILGFPTNSTFHASVAFPDRAEADAMEADLPGNGGTTSVFNNWDGERDFASAAVSQTGADFLFVKVGDFNGNLDFGTNLTGNSPSEARQGAYDLSVSDVEFKAGALTTITVSASDLPAEHIVLLPLQLDPSVEIVGVNSGLLEMTDNYFIDHESNTINLYSLPATDELAEGKLSGELFTIDVRLNNNTSRSRKISAADILFINERFAANYADPVTEEIRSLDLAFVTPDVSTSPVRITTQVFPTAFDEQVTLAFGESYLQGGTIRLADQTGKVVITRPFGALNVGDNVQIQTLGSLPSGTYFISLIVDGEVALTQRVIKK